MITLAQPALAPSPAPRGRGLGRGLPLLPPSTSLLAKDGRGEQSARQQDLGPGGWEEVPNLGKAILGNETRLGVLVEVAMGIGRATPIAERLGVERCDVSKHMALLFRSGLVRVSLEDPLAYVLSPHVRVRRDATGVDIVVTADNGLELRVAVTTAEE